MNIVDSSGWLEYFADGRNASFFEAPIIKVAELVVPSVSLYEVFKRVFQQRGESEALVAVALMQQGSVVDLDASLASAPQESPPRSSCPWPTASSWPLPGLQALSCLPRPRISTVWMASATSRLPEGLQAGYQVTSRG